MDVPCPRCTEPWDTEVFYALDDTKRVFRRFKLVGCVAIVKAMEGETGEFLATCEQTPEGKTISALMDIAGDEPGDVASDIEDFQAAGLL